MPLQILVAGGGIGGLAAALACARGGAHVQLHERAPELREFGAGIQLGPNATRVLGGWGLADELRRVAAAPRTLRIFGARDGAELASLPLGADIASRYGAPYLTVHRADLQALLLRPARGEGVEPVLGSRLDSVIDDGVHVTAGSATGSPVRADALIAADGVWSVLRRSVLGDGLARPTGHIAFRAVAEQASLPLGVRSDEVHVWLGPRMHVVTYPVRAGAWLNVVALVEAVARPHAQDWDQEATAAELRSALGPVAPRLLERIVAMPGWRAWTLHGRRPVEGPNEMARGRVALLGDAAHPMLPYLAQGAGMALEDAQVLAASLSAEADPAAAIRRYAQERWRRCARVQQGAFRNARIFHADGFMRWGRDAAMRFLGGRLLDQPWLWGR